MTYKSSVLFLPVFRSFTIKAVQKLIVCILPVLVLLALFHTLVNTGGYVATTHTALQSTRSTPFPPLGLYLGIERMKAIARHLNTLKDAYTPDVLIHQFDHIDFFDGTLLIFQNF